MNPQTVAFTFGSLFTIGGLFFFFLGFNNSYFVKEVVKPTEFEQPTKCTHTTCLWDGEEGFDTGVRFDDPNQEEKINKIIQLRAKRFEAQGRLDPNELVVQKDALVRSITIKTNPGDIVEMGDNDPNGVVIEIKRSPK